MQQDWAQQWQSPAEVAAAMLCSARTHEMGGSHINHAALGENFSAA